MAVISDDVVSTIRAATAAPRLFDASLGSLNDALEARSDGRGILLDDIVGVLRTYSATIGAY